MDISKLKAITSPDRQHKYHSEVVKSAKKFQGFYTGNIDDKTLFAYREEETEEQKKQRKRIYIPRTKHVCSNIENIFDNLRTLDTAAIKVMADNAKNTKAIETLIYELNIENQAFNFTKYGNMVDPNAFLVAGLDEDDTMTFELISSENVFNYKITNEAVKYLVIKEEDPDTKKTRFKIYTPEEIITGTNDGGAFVEVERMKTKTMYALHIGYDPDPSTNFKTFKSILDPASYLFVQLIQDGSEYDTIKNCHGIEKTFAFAPTCDYKATMEKGIEYCRSGSVYIGNEYVKQCQVCKGTGLKIHTSSQDIIYLPEPLDKQEYLPLDKLVHTVDIPEQIITSLKEDIKDLEGQIIRTVFNANTVSKDDIGRTATEIRIDQNGVTSALTHFGNKNSEVFIWMVNCLAASVNIEIKSIFHGYTMELQFTLQDILAARQKAVSSGVSYDILKTIDFSILKKQHMDNPEYINEYSIWETFRPFADKSETERASIVGDLPEKHPDRILSIWFAEIKANVISKYPTFYTEMKRDKQLEAISIEVQKKIELMAGNEPERVIVPEFQTQPNE